MWVWGRGEGGFGGGGLGWCAGKKRGQSENKKKKKKKKKIKKKKEERKKLTSQHQRRQHPPADQQRQQRRRRPPVPREHPLRQRDVHPRRLLPVRVAVLLVVLARDLVGERLVRLGDRLCEVGRGGRVRVLVRVVLEGQGAVGAARVGRRGAARDLQDLPGVERRGLARGGAAGPEQQQQPERPRAPEEGRLLVVEQGGEDAGHLGLFRALFFVVVVVVELVWFWWRRVREGEGTKSERVSARERGRNEKREEQGSDRRAAATAVKKKKSMRAPRFNGRVRLCRRFCRHRALEASP